MTRLKSRIDSHRPTCSGESTAFISGTAVISDRNRAAASREQHLCRGIRRDNTGTIRYRHSRRVFWRLLWAYSTRKAVKLKRIGHFNTVENCWRYKCTILKLSDWPIRLLLKFYSLHFATYYGLISLMPVSCYSSQQKLELNWLWLSVTVGEISLFISADTDIWFLYHVLSE